MKILADKLFNFIDKISVVDCSEYELSCLLKFSIYIGYLNGVLNLADGDQYHKSVN